MDIRRRGSVLLAAALVGVVITVIWRTCDTWAAPPPSGRVAPVGVEPRAPLPTAIRLRALNQEIQDEAEELAGIGAGLKSGQPLDGQGEEQRQKAVAGEKLRRSDLLSILARRPQRLTAVGPGQARIVDTDVNPAGRQFSDELVAAFGVWEKVYVYRLAKMKGGLQELRSEEMESLARAGALRPLTYTADPVIVAEMEEARELDRKSGYPGSSGDPGFHGPQYYEGGEGLTFFLRVGGSNYGASEADLPDYQACKALYGECVREAYIEAAKIALAAGLLDQSQFELRLERAREWNG